MDENSILTQDTLDALRRLQALMSSKSPIPDELWAQAGVKKGERQKEIDKIIVKNKKLISKLIKSDLNEELLKEAKELNVTFQDQIAETLEEQKKIYCQQRKDDVFLKRRIARENKVNSSSF